MSEHDESLNRMRAADPAIGSHPNLSELSSKIAAEVAAESDRAVRVNERSARRSRVPMIAAAAALAMGVGVGGYAIGAGTADGGGEQAGPVSVQNGAEAGPTADLGQGQRPGSIGGNRTESGGGYSTQSGSAVGEDSETSWPGGMGGQAVVLNPGPGLSTTGGTGEVLQPVPLEGDLEERLTAWAERLGLEGSVQVQDELWASLDSGAITLSINGGSYAGLDYSNSDLQIWCDDAFFEILPEDVEGAEPTSEPAPVSPSECELGLTEVDEATALDVAADFLTDAGLDAEAYTLEIAYTDGLTTEVYGTSSSGVVPTRASISVTSEGVSYGYVQLPLEYASLGDYPVISATEAVERLNQPRYTSWYVSIPSVDDAWRGGWNEPGWVEPEPIVLQPGQAIPFAVTEATITEATLTTGLLGLADGTELAVPAYDLRDENGTAYSVIAVADSALDFTG